MSNSGALLRDSFLSYHRHDLRLETLHFHVSTLLRARTGSTAQQKGRQRRNDRQWAYSIRHTAYDMADQQLPLPGTPRTRTMLDEHAQQDEHDENQLPMAGLGIEGAYSSPIDSRFAFDPTSSPPSETTGSGSARTDILSPTFSITASSPNELYSPLTPQSVTSDSQFLSQDAPNKAKNPFNFTPQQYSVGKPSTLSRVVRQSYCPSCDFFAVPSNLYFSFQEPGKRRGHTYQRSSIHISAGMIPEPARKAPLQLPASLPTPTRSEIHKSMTPDQKARLTWCLCHFLVAAYVQWSAHGSLAMTALSRLLFFDAAGAVTCVLVEVMGNFEVWRGSSIKHPFGYVVLIHLE